MLTSTPVGDHISGPPSSQMTVALRLLREAAQSAVVVWSESPYLQRRACAQRQLCQALDDVRTVAAGLAVADQRPQLREFSRCLDQAWRSVQATPAAQGGEPPGSSGDHGDVLCAAARLAVAVWKQQAPGQETPEAGISELLGAVQALAQAACELARSAAEPVAGRLHRARDRLTAAAGHLQELAPATPVPEAGSRHGHPDGQASPDEGPTG